MKKILFFLGLIVSVSLNAQQSFLIQPYGADHGLLELEEMVIPSFPKFHSSAVGFYDGKWVVIGGRTNGLHGFYPPFAFPTNGIQNQLNVIDPASGSVWSLGLDSLPQPLKEQFSSSNMQHCVKGDKLYISGGYGYSETQDEYITFPYFTEVNMDLLMDHVVAGTNPTDAFKYTVDSAMAVTGGRMHEKNDLFYLFFGHKFTGRYSTTPGDVFEQEYTYQVKMFNISTTIDSLNITNYNAITDSVNFRRRDLNVTPYIIAGPVTDTVGFMAWSGVFQKDVDRPYTNQIFIHTDGTYRVINSEQRYNQYHCATIPILFDPFTSVIFIGGMAESKQGTSAVDTLVPFVKNLSIVTYDQNTVHEIVSGDTLDNYFGTNSEFIPNEAFVDAESGMSTLQDCNQRNLLGYVIGGIESTGPHISNMNDPSLSFASEKVYRVYATRYCWGIDEFKTASIQVFPNPSQDRIQVKTDEVIANWQVVDISGKVQIQQKSNGTNTLDVSELKSGTYFVKIFTEQNMYRSSFIKL